jgi:hypothetical protein
MRGTFDNIENPPRRKQETELSAPQSQYAEYGDARIHYTVHGSGDPLILLHGGGPGATGLSNYSRNIAALAEHFTCYVIDFPGWGQSSKNLDSFGAPSPFLPMGDKAAVLDIQTAGSVLSGAMRDDDGADDALYVGSIDGSAFRWKADVKSPFPMTLGFTGHIDGDKISGGAAGPFGSTPFTGSRR